MKFIYTPVKKIILTIFLVSFIFIFSFGIFIGNKYGESIPVLNQKKLVPIYSVNRDDKLVAITLDGTWGAEKTDQILEILREEEVKISFFFAGYWLEKYPDVVKKIAAEGHEIENHTFTHPHCKSLSKDKLIDELESTSDLVEKLIGKRPKYFRPPFGEYNNNVIKTSNDLGYQVIQWTIDSHDWMEPGVDYIVDRVMSNVKSGDIILMHNNAPDTPEALGKIIPELKEKGFKIVPLSKMVYKDNYYVETYTGRQIKTK
ncbi:MAG: polysaccharide deacetylase family protein [Halanaerobiales bacterium]